jgi:hypothetical protein
MSARHDRYGDRIEDDAPEKSVGHALMRIAEGRPGKPPRT